MSIFSPTFRLLQKEGFLMQGCLKSSLVAMRAGNVSQSGPFFVALFNYSIGLERLLKLILVLDHYGQNAGQFPNDKFLRSYKHDLGALHQAALALFPRYGVSIEPQCRLDTIDLEALDLMREFAQQSRYFNLDTLTGSSKNLDPLQRWHRLIKTVYDTDIPELHRIGSQDHVTGLAQHFAPTTTYIPTFGLDDTLADYEDFCQDSEKVRFAMPHVIWRLVKPLAPLKDLLIALREQLHRQFIRPNDNTDIPFMEEFLDFVCSDKTALDEESWPYFEA